MTICLKIMMIYLLKPQTKPTPKAHLLQVRSNVWPPLELQNEESLSFDRYAIRYFIALCPGFVYRSAAQIPCK